eukprot:15481934-Alexandrium_andersonii.AAC.1
MAPKVLLTVVVRIVLVVFSAMTPQRARDMRALRRCVCVCTSLWQLLDSAIGPSAVWPISQSLSCPRALFRVHSSVRSHALDA